MRPSPPQFTLELLGTFRLSGPSGERIEVASRKGAALIALLAMGGDGERTRSWLQDKLWGSRQQAQARDSLRRELSNLRRQLNDQSAPLLVCLRDRVRLDLTRVQVDARAPAVASARDAFGAAEFLEGFDIPSEEGFEEWLREQRALLRMRQAGAVDPAVPLPRRFMDVTLPTPGFDGRPALAVLPFGNQTGDPAADYLSEGVSEDLIDRLSRLRWLPVIARSSSFGFRSGEDPAAVLERLGAKYLVDGRVRRTVEGLGLSATLSDLETGLLLWSQRVELPADGSPAALETLIAELAGVLESRIDHAEQTRALAKPQSDLNVHELIWRGRWHLNRLTREDAERARALFEEALAREPNSPEALIQATSALGWSIWAKREAQDNIVEMRRLAQRAIMADPEDGRGYMLAGIADTWLKRPATGQALLRQAVDLNPSLAPAHWNLGTLHNLRGEPRQALPHLAVALRLSPYDTHIFFPLGELALAHCMLGNWDLAVEYANHALARRPAYWYAHAAKINALVRSGDLISARAAFRELNNVKPNFRLGYLDWIPFLDRSWNEYFAAGVGQVEDAERALEVAG